MPSKPTIIKPDLLVLVVDMKTGKVSVNGGPFREANFIARKLEPGELEGSRAGGTSTGTSTGGVGTSSGGGGTSSGGGGTSPGGGGGGQLPVDEIVCAHTAGNPQCRKFYRTSGGSEWIETPWICSAPCDELT